jgi:hypothetical protein
MKLEVFMTIPNFENYKISTYGRVFSKKSNKNLKPMFNKYGYEIVNLYKNGKRCAKTIHRIVAKTFLSIENFENKQIDHIDGNRKNNFFLNLRECTSQQNNFNRGKNKNNKSGYKGVGYDKKARKWVARICENRKEKYLGSFQTKEEAHEAYKQKAKKIHGHYCYNFL